MPIIFSAHDEDEEEEVRLRRRVQLYAEERPPVVGELQITTKRVIWQPDDTSAPTVSIIYPAIMMHAVSRDVSAFHSACLYMQLDGQHRIEARPAAAAAAPPAANGVAPMDVGENMNGAVAADEGDEDNSDEEEGDEGDEETQEVRLVPLDVETGGLDAALDGLFEALSACAALNPDDDDDESDEEGDDEGAIERLDGLEGLEGLVDTQSLLASVSPAQRAMLERYDDMLDASSVETGVGNLQVDNRDGRFDDAADDDDDNEEPHPIN